MGMYDIFEHCPQDVQVSLFSATYTPEVLEVTERMCRNPFKILVKKEEVTLDGIKQFFVDCEKDSYKLEILCDLYECLSISQLIIFVNSKRRVECLPFFKRTRPHLLLHPRRHVYRRAKIENARISNWSFSCAYFNRSVGAWHRCPECRHGH